MAWVPAIDISRYQPGDDYSEEIIIIKMSGGDDGLYYDSLASQHYYAAQRNGKAIGMYHFAGGTDAVNEADFFVRACSPLTENDVLVLDWEIQHPDPVGWCKTFIQRVIDQTGVKPLIYMNTSTENSQDWSPIVNMDVGLWVADYRFSPEENVPIRHWPTYVMHQYTSTPLDRDAWFGTVDQFKAYGFHVQPTPVPEPTPPVQPPSEVPPVIPQSPIEPPATPQPEPIPPITPLPPVPTNWKVIVGAVLAALAALIAAVVHWVHN